MTQEIDCPFTDPEQCTLWQKVFDEGVYVNGLKDGTTLYSLFALPDGTYVENEKNPFTGRHIAMRLISFPDSVKHYMDMRQEFKNINGNEGVKGILL